MAGTQVQCCILWHSSAEDAPATRSSPGSSQNRPVRQTQWKKSSHNFWLCHEVPSTKIQKGSSGFFWEERWLYQNIIPVLMFFSFLIRSVLACHGLYLEICIRGNTDENHGLLDGTHQTGILIRYFHPFEIVSTQIQPTVQFNRI